MPVQTKSRSQSAIRATAAAFALLLIPAIFGGLYFLMQAEFAQVRELRSTTEQAIATRDDLQQLLIAHIDAETAVRGYVITQNPDFLQPYNASLERRERLFQILRQRLDPDLQPQLAALQQVSDTRWENLRANLADVRAGRVDAARRRTASGAGKALMDDIRDRIARIDRTALDKIQGLSAAVTGSRAGVEKAVTTLMIGLGLLLLVVAVVTGRSLHQRREALARVKRLADRQKAMFEGAVDPMLLLDSEGRILRMNPSVSRMFGYEEHELLHRHNTVLMESRFTLEQSMAWLASVGEAGAHGAGRRQEFTGRCKDGSTFETEIAISRFISDGEHQYVVAIRDITDRKRAEKMKNEFVSTVSHELRTPLTSIGGSLGLLSAGAVGPLNEKAQRLVTIAHSNCERLIRLINDILDIEKIESGKMEFDHRRMQVAPLVQRTASAMRGFAEQHRVRIAVDLPTVPESVVGDPDRLEQLLTNLMSNAIKHSPEGAQVEVSVRRDGDMTRIEVADRGAGIPLDFRKRIFGKFAMADASDSRAKGGTGLGLSIVREIAQHHGGDVGFADREGGGTIFFVTIPRIEDNLPERPERNGKHRLPKVLHVDDDLDCLNVVSSAFAERAEIVSCGSLDQAHELVASQRFAAAIIDIDMHSEDGLRLIPQLREAQPNVPILLFTALDSGYTDTGADKVLVKSRASIGDLVSETMRLIAASKRKAA
ncbi:MAG: CHASE3 domain-containing protein [Rhodobacteraceae bacterium]|nr:CHASE3 domain-containing protein [Paracoccaceae bacterium]